jgi:hypothetical protein
MTRLSDDPADAELQRLVTRFLDRSLTTEESARLEQRLRDEPAAMDYCANAVRFEATLQESVNPQALEWEETRRVVFDPKQDGPAWSVQRQQTVRYGNPRSLPAFVRRSRRGWILGGLTLLALATAGAFYYFRIQERSYSLRNGDFEAMDLSQSPSGVGRSLLYWQDNFSTSGAELCEIGRVSGGKLFAKSGRNVVRLQNRAFLNQLLLNRRGAALKAKPGYRVALTGWSYAEGKEAHSLRASLRFVASAYPDMIQYEAANATVPIADGGWHPFRIDLVVPDNLLSLPSDLASSTHLSPPPIDLDGKDLTLSLDNRSPNAVLYLDDLKVEVSPPGK